jgi:hypothetical protein
MYRLQAPTVSNKKSAKTLAATIDVKPCPHARVNLRCLSSQTRLRLDFKRESCPLVIIQDAPRLIEISLERSGSADVQSNAVGPTAQHFGVPQFQGDYIKPLFF